MCKHSAKGLKDPAAQISLRGSCGFPQTKHALALFIHLREQWTQMMYKLDINIIISLTCSTIFFNSTAFIYIFVFLIFSDLGWQKCPVSPTTPRPQRYLLLMNDSQSSVFRFIWLCQSKTKRNCHYATTRLFALYHFSSAGNLVANLIII